MLFLRQGLSLPIVDIEQNFMYCLNSHSVNMQSNSGAVAAARASLVCRPLL